MILSSWTFRGQTLSDVEDAAGCHNNTVLIYTNAAYGIIGDLIHSISIVENLNQFWVS